MHPVVRLIHERWQTNSKPGQRTDGHKLGLAVEGGGMRGVVSAGMVNALEYLGLREVFDVLYGTSAGAINGAYFLAGQAAFGTTIYYQNINNRRFINRWRFFTRRPVLSLEYVLDHVAVKEKVLDWRKVIESSVPLKVVASSVTQARGVVLDGFTSWEDLRESLRATARLPILAGPPVPHRGDSFLDGGIYDAIPVSTALADGCTHVLALATRPAGCPPADPWFFVHWYVSRYCHRLNPALPDGFQRRNENYRRTVALLEDKTRTGAGPPYIMGITLPPASPLVKQTELRRSALVRGASLGMDAVFRALTEHCPTPVEVLVPFSALGHPLEVNHVQRPESSAVRTP